MLILEQLLTIAQANDIFGMPFYEADNVFKLLIRFTLNIIVLIILVRYLYYPVSRRKDYLFTYFLIGIVVFLLCFLLENVKLQLGFALGLFAIFGIIRYRTTTIQIKEMTYLFIVIGVSVINALANKKISQVELMLTNFLILAVTFGLERIWLLKHEIRKNIRYENIELIKPENRKELIEDLENRTGLKINRIEVRGINFLNDTARIRIFYFSEEIDINKNGKNIQP